MKILIQTHNFDIIKMYLTTITCEKILWTQKIDFEKFGSTFIEISCFELQTFFCFVFKIPLCKTHTKKILSSYLHFFKMSKNLSITILFLKMYICLAQHYPWTSSWHHLMCNPPAISILYCKFSWLLFGNAYLKFEKCWKTSQNERAHHI